jgi:cell division protein FtsB
VKKITNTSITNIAGGVLAIWILVALAQTVANNYKLEKQIETLRQQISVLQAQKDELGYNIAYYNTDSFKQRQARLRLGLEQPGENVIILPTPSPTSAPTTDAAAAKAKRSNLRQWLDFLTGKG